MSRSATTSWPTEATLEWFYQLIDDPCENAELDAEVQRRVRARQITIISRMTPVVMIGKISCAAALGLILFQDSQLTPLPAIWVIVAIGLSLNSIFRHRQRRGKPEPTDAPRERMNKIVTRTILFAFLWAFPGLVLLPSLTSSAYYFVIVMSAGMIAGGAVSLYAMPSAAILYCSILTLCSLVGIAITGGTAMASYFIIAAAFIFVASKSILKYSEIFVSEFIVRLELDRKNAEIKQLLAHAETETIAERKRSETRLVQAQKMEAIGQLTGGIAHDFNNLLAAIQGNTELLELEGKADHSLTHPILQSTRRGSALVHRLLSFASKQILRPQRLDVGDLIENMRSLLHRTVTTDARIETDIAPDLWDVHADPGQLEAALVNLVLNSCEALPRGGRIQIVCKNVLAKDNSTLRDLGVRAGGFVCIEVRDNGAGMSARTRDRAIDPFFTTKSVGQGSGLGLSTVYGFVRQSGGRLSIESELGTGTAITVFLPRLIEGTVTTAPTHQFGEMPYGHQERILVVEDDHAVQKMVGDMLDSLNFQVIFAGTGEECLDQLRSSADVDLVLTDVVLPGELTGPHLANRLAKEHPDLSVLFMSGFTARSVLYDERMEDRLLKKPFNRRELADFVCNGLERSLA